MQLEPVSGGKYRGMVHAFQTIAREEGLKGLWRGTVPALLLWVPYTVRTRGRPTQPHTAHTHTIKTIADAAREPTGDPVCGS